jgi:hypothetical protein
MLLTYLWLYRDYARGFITYAITKFKASWWFNLRELLRCLSYLWLFRGYARGFITYAISKFKHLGFSIPWSMCCFSSSVWCLAALLAFEVGVLSCVFSKGCRLVFCY